MSHINVHVHLVWGTFERTPYLHSPSIRNDLWEHIWANCHEKKVFIKAVGGFDDHCHCLISLGGSDSLSRIAQLIKGESANWMNKKGLVNKKFSWASEYYAAGVSPGSVLAVRSYIDNQDRHHRTKTFREELDEFVAANFAKGGDGPDGTGESPG
jgi:putative transposase